MALALHLGLGHAPRPIHAEAPEQPASRAAGWSAPGRLQGPEPPPGDAARRFVIVEGQITDSVGAGQADVTVTVRRKAVDGGPGEVLATTTTDALGDFSAVSSVPVHGDIVVTFSKARYTDLTRELHIGETDEFPPYLAEVLEGRLVVIGRVADARTGRAVPGASVTLQTAARDWNAATDELGQFTLKNVTPGQGELIVAASGYGRQRQKIARLEDFGEIVIRIKPERIVRLHVVDDRAEPIAGATVEVSDEPRDDFRTAVTDAAGVVTFRGIHFDAAVLTARLTHQDHVSSEWFDREIVMPERQTESTHTLVMDRAGRIGGTVTAARTGAPLHGARLLAGERHTDTSPRDWTDDRGRYVIHGVKPGRTVVTVHLAGYAPDLKTIQVGPAATAHINFQLSVGAVLTGSVKDANGQPVGGALVETGRWRGWRTLGLRAVTGRDGRFTIDSVPPDEFEITVYARGAGERTRTVKGDNRTDLEITLPGVATGEAEVGQGKVKVGDAVPAIRVTTLQGVTLDLAELAGKKTVLVDFWATWCGPCVADLPHLIKVHEKFGARKDFVMVGISLDDDEKALREFLAARKMTWAQVFGQSGGAAVAADRFGVSGIPALFLLGPDGRVEATYVRGVDVLKGVEQTLRENDPGHNPP